MANESYQKVRADEATIEERIAELVSSEARRLLWQRFGRSEPGLTKEKIKVEIWKENPELVALIRSRFASMPFAEARNEIRKDQRYDFTEALNLLASGFPR
ncbi:MAG: hypothetical protein OEM84_03545 [Acidimicrobiia bacterium]|nr:hypothetical protein [Acidimicrobiia bacterium]